MLSAWFRRPSSIIAGISPATLANHALAGVIGFWFGRYLTATILHATVGVQNPRHVGLDPDSRQAR